MISFDNIRYYTGSYNEFAGYAFRNIINNSDKKLIIVHINLRNLYFLNKDSELKNDISKNCTVVFDGIGLKIGFWLRGYGLLPDLNGTDLFPLMINKMCESKMAVFFLGSEERVIANAVQNIRIDYPKLNINGFHHGCFLLEEEEQVVEEINRNKPDVLIVGRGFPLQEQFVLRNRNKLCVSLIWNVGGLFDFISGSKPRAPYILRKMRLEWLFRFILEPRRMLQRNTVCAFWSLWHIIFSGRSVKI